MAKLRSSGSRAISENLRSRILRGEFLPGQKMPTVRSLAEDLNVSSDTTFRAYKRLQESGLLVMNRGSFTTVACPLPGENEAGILRNLVATGPINEYEALSESSNVRSFATNVPDLKFFQADSFLAEIRDVLNHGQWGFYYSPPQGDLGLRIAISEWLNKLGTSCSQENIVITLGAQHGLALTSRYLLGNGNKIAIEGADHLGGPARWASLGLERIVIPRLPGEVSNIDGIVSCGAKAIVVSPTGCGLSGRTLTSSDRQAIKDICKFNEIAILEDVSNSFVTYEDRPMDMFDMSGEVIQVGSFSNILAPGIRQGFIVASQDQCHDLARMIQNDTGGLALPIQIALASFIRKGLLKDHIRRVIPRYKKRRNSLLSGLAIHMPKHVSWSIPKAGFGCRVSFREESDVERLYERTVERGVSFTPGKLLVHANEANKTIRVCFGNQSESRIAEGTRILGELLS
ncbi:MAG: PLP-dependent aminotransferase family protein [Armatimonadota bacterium]